MSQISPDYKIRNFEQKQKILSILALIIFCGLSVIINNVHLSQVADDNTKLLSRLFTIGDQREIVHILQQAHLSNFDVIRYKSSNSEKSFVIPANTEIFENKNPFRSLITDRVTIPVSMGMDHSSVDLITFEFNRFKLVPYAVALWLLLVLVSVPQLSFMKKRLKEKYLQEVELERKAVKSELAHEVRHNFRTPLAALMRIPSRLPFAVNEEKVLLQNTIDQIQDLISKLDDKTNTQITNTKISIYETLSLSRNEISLTLPQNIKLNFKMDDSLASAYANHIPFELRSIISNLVNNAVEATSDSGKIIINITDKIDSVEITVSDDGAGIPTKILPQIFEKNFSHNKVNGSGIGLTHAKEFIENWIGSINVTSSLGFGTSVQINLPIQSRKPWYLPRLKIHNDSDIFVLDDQQLNLDLWKFRFNDAEIKNNIYYFKNKDELYNKTTSHDFNLKNSIFLFDYDLGDTKTGLDLLNEIPNEAIKCLVTGHFDDIEVQSKCAESGVYLLSKGQIAEIVLCLVDKNYKDDAAASSLLLKGI